jgi:glutamate synthase domain-containing protein 2
MSYGALSKNAVLALNGGAQIGRFAHNTGEGSISPYHLEPNGDLIWQTGTGYFGCRDKEGQFSTESFAQKAQLDAVKGQPPQNMATDFAAATAVSFKPI